MQIYYFVNPPFPFPQEPHGLRKPSHLLCCRQILVSPWCPRELVLNGLTTNTDSHFTCDFCIFLPLHTTNSCHLLSSCCMPGVCALQCSQPMSEGVGTSSSVSSGSHLSSLRNQETGWLTESSTAGPSFQNRCSYPLCSSPTWKLGRL